MCHRKYIFQKQDISEAELRQIVGRQPAYITPRYSGHPGRLSPSILAPPPVPRGNRPSIGEAGQVHPDHHALPVRGEHPQ